MEQRSAPLESAWQLMPLPDCGAQALVDLHPLPTGSVPTTTPRHAAITFRYSDDEVEIYAQELTTVGAPEIQDCAAESLNVAPGIVKSGPDAMHRASSAEAHWSTVILQQFAMTLQRARAA